VLLVGTSLAQIYLPEAPPPQASDYGKVILDTYSAAPAGPGAVVFDHWLHRSRFTCRLCHVDIGFAMKAKATEIRAASNRQGFHCGACHDGKRVINGKTVFASCSDDVTSKQCARCHSLGKTGVREDEYKKFTAKFPKARYGINWEAAENAGIIHPIDFLDGISVKREAMMRKREDFSIKAGYPWVHPIEFSHEKHAIWNGCELCHPEIFPLAKSGSTVYSISMFANIEGRYCGACHTKVAFPLNNCRLCHPRAPAWAP
jgi:c(7)-type cytochrome triheme protein